MTSNRRRVAAQRRKASSTSPPSTDTKPDFVVVARLRRPHGLKGEILAQILSDFPERFKPNAVFLLGDEHRPITIDSVRGHNDGLLLAFKGISDREGWKGLQNTFLYVRAEDLPNLDASEHYHHDLIGLEVVDEEGNAWGVVSEILQTGANDVYATRDEEGRERLVPATTQVVKDIDLKLGRILITPLPGLFED